jgi:hypothetical protein
MAESTPREPGTRIITVKETRLTLPDLLDDLLWPKLFRAAPLALQPGHIGLALFTLAAVGLIGIANTWLGAESSFFDMLASAWTPAPGVDASRAGPVGLTLARAGALISEHPFNVFLQGIPMLAALAIGVGAISRMSAAEFSSGVNMTWAEGLGFIIGRWPSALGAAFAAPLLIGIIALALAIMGVVFLQLPGLDIAGAIGFIVVILLALLGAVLTLGLLLGHSMLVPALACEGTDAIDALQRVYAYVLARPGRLVAYSLVLAFILAATALALYTIASGTEYLARSATGAWLAPSPGSILNPDSAVASADSPAATRAIAAEIVSFWIGLVWMTCAAGLFATYVSGFTILYLIMRQASDGQDWGELWFPEHTQAGRDELSIPSAGDTSVRAMNVSARIEETT